MNRCHPKTRAIEIVIAGVLLAGASLPAVQAQALRPSAGITDAAEERAGAAIRQKLKSLVIPSIEFHATTLGDAIEYLRQESRRVDTEGDPQSRGISIVLKLPAAMPSIVSMTGTEAANGTAAPAAATTPNARTRITLTLGRIPLLEALKYVAAQAGLKIRIEPYAVSLVPLTENTDTMVTATFRVPPSMIGNVTGSSVGGRTMLDQPAVPAQ